MFKHNSAQYSNTTVHSIQTQQCTVLKNNSAHYSNTTVHTIQTQQCTLFKHNSARHSSTTVHNIQTQQCTVFIHNCTQYSNTVFKHAIQPSIYSSYVSVCWVVLRKRWVSEFYARSQNSEKWLLPSSSLSVCLSVSMKQLGSHWKIFYDIWYLCIFPKSVEKTSFFKVWQE